MLTCSMVIIVKYAARILHWGHSTNNRLETNYNITSETFLKNHLSRAPLRGGWWRLYVVDGGASTLWMVAPLRGGCTETLVSNGLRMRSKSPLFLPLLLPLWLGPPTRGNRNTAVIRGPMGDRCVSRIVSQSHHSKQHLTRPTTSTTTEAK